MLLQSEILQCAVKEEVPPDTVDKDWVLGHFLAVLFQQNWAREKLVFKGGTCLKKCYFPNYRFSEDLDFTLIDADFVITGKLLQSVCKTISDRYGILFSKVKLESIRWENTQVGYKTHIRFWGANHKKSQMPPDSLRWQTSIKIEIVFYEEVVHHPVKLPLYSEYSDKNSFEGICIPCYTISEILAEKFRALLQRSYPAPRDYYDLWYIFNHYASLNREEVVSTFKKKIQCKQIPFSNQEDFFEENRLKKMKKEWNNSLKSHIKEGKLADVDSVIHELKNICNQIKWN